MCSREGRRGPTTGGRPRVCLRRTGGDRIQSKRGTERHLLPGAVEAQFQDAVDQVAHQLDRDPWQPAAYQAHQLAGAHAERFVAQPQPLTHVRSGSEHYQEGQSPSLSCPRHLHHDRQHDPAQARATHGALTAGASASAIVAPFGDMGAPTSFQGFVDDQIQRPSSLGKRLDDKIE